MLIDTHCHLDDSKFENKPREAIDRAVAAGVTRMITVGTDEAGTDEAYMLASMNAEVWCTAGVHPHEADRVADQDLTTWLVNCAKRDRCVGIGETGLDRFKGFSEIENQRRLFLQHVEAARRTGKAIVIHCRDAHKELNQILRAEMKPPVRGVIHCFSGDEADVEHYLGLGFVLSIAGPVTFKNAQTLQAAARKIPLDRMVVETDSPYLAPEPVRGGRNEPAFVRHTAEFLARLKDVPFEEFARVTSDTAARVFGL